jgi:hypothetical protein
MATPCPIGQINLAIVGSRTYGITNYNNFCIIVDNFIKLHCTNMKVTIVTGDESKGVDFLASKYALEHQLECILFIADWNKHGLAAGPIRNKKIVTASHLMLALPSRNGKGTQNSINQMLQVNKPVYSLYID